MLVDFYGKGREKYTIHGSHDNFSVWRIFSDFFLDKGTATGILTRSAKDVDKGHTSKSVELLSWAIRG